MSGGEVLRRAAASPLPHTPADVPLGGRTLSLRSVAATVALPSAHPLLAEDAEVLTSETDGSSALSLLVTTAPDWRRLQAQWVGGAPTIRSLFRAADQSRHPLLLTALRASGAVLRPGRPLRGLYVLTSVPAPPDAVACGQHRRASHRCIRDEADERMSLCYELQRSVAAVELGRVARGWLRGRRLVRRVRAARVIQRSWARHRSTVADRVALRTKLTAQKRAKAATAVQRLWRGWRDRMHRARQLPLERRTAWEIRAVAPRPPKPLRRVAGGRRLLHVGAVAGLQLEQKQPLLRQLLLLRHEQRVGPRIRDPRINAVCRRFAAKLRLALQRLQQRRDSAANRIQGLRRMLAARQEVRARRAQRRRVDAAITIQAWVRGRWRRDAAHRLQCRAAPVVIQRWFRRRRARQRGQELAHQLQRVRTAAAAIQGLWRGYFHRSCVWPRLRPRLCCRRLGPMDRKLRRAMRRRLDSRLEEYLPSKATMAVDARGHLQILADRSPPRPPVHTTRSAAPSPIDEGDDVLSQLLWPMPPSPAASIHSDTPVPAAAVRKRVDVPLTPGDSQRRGATTPPQLPTPKRFEGLSASDWWNHRRLPGLASPGSSDATSSSSASSAVLSVGAEVRRATAEALDRRRDGGLAVQEPPSPPPAPSPQLQVPSSPMPEWVSLEKHVSLAAALREAVKQTPTPGDCIRSGDWSKSLRSHGGRVVGPLRRRGQAASTRASGYGVAEAETASSEMSGVPRASSASSSLSVSSSLLETFWGPDIVHGRRRRLRVPHPHALRDAAPQTAVPGRMRPPPRDLKRKSALDQALVRRPVAESHTAAAQFVQRRPTRTRASVKRPEPLADAVPRPSPPPAHRAAKRAVTAPSASDLSSAHEYSAVHGCSWGYLLLKEGGCVEGATRIGTLPPPTAPDGGRVPRAQTADGRRVVARCIRHRSAASARSPKCRTYFGARDVRVLQRLCAGAARQSE
eukprot:TRINITY_DN14357_c0_g1_i3.p1 TRINITY_DN14357_c0_g1~~TRINITY_DN14357_c0_g1_i3.p1  ORF type:complete len:984 (+),score=267.05 TRINITY_DN14357_c0_g1_i3:50-2953(+)